MILDLDDLLIYLTVGAGALVRFISGIIQVGLALSRKYVDEFIQLFKTRQAATLIDYAKTKKKELCQVSVFSEMLGDILSLYAPGKLAILNCWILYVIWIWRVGGWRWREGRKKVERR